MNDPRALKRVTQELSPQVLGRVRESAGYGELEVCLSRLLERDLDAEEQDIVARGVVERAAQSAAAAVTSLLGFGISDDLCDRLIDAAATPHQQSQLRSRTLEPDTPGPNFRPSRRRR